MKRCASVAQKGSIEATISVGDNGKAFVAWAMAQCTGSAPSGPVLLKKRRLFRPDDDEDDDDSETEQEQASVEALRAAAEQQDWDTITAWLDDNGAKVFALASWSPTFRRATSPPSQYGHQRFMKMSRYVAECLDMASDSEIPGSGAVLDYLKQLCKPAERGGRRAEKNRTFREEHPGVHAAAVYLLWAWLPRYLHIVYSERAGQLQEGDGPFPDQAEQQAEQFDERAEVYQYVHDTSFDALVEALTSGWTAMKRAADDATDDIP